MTEQMERPAMSFRELFDANYTTLYKIAYTYMGNSYDAEDAVQESFMRYLRLDKALRGENAEKAWLIVTLGNVCKDMLRRACRRDESIDAHLNLAAQPPERNELLEEIIKLPFKYKAPIYLYYYEGYSVEETARILSQSPAAIKTQLHRARRRLKEQLKEASYD